MGSYNKLFTIIKMADTQKQSAPTNATPTEQATTPVQNGNPTNAGKDTKAADAAKKPAWYSNWWSGVKTCCGRTDPATTKPDATKVKTDAAKNDAAKNVEGNAPKPTTTS